MASKDWIWCHYCLYSLLNSNCSGPLSIGAWWSAAETMRGFPKYSCLGLNAKVCLMAIICLLPSLCTTLEWLVKTAEAQTPEDESLHCHLLGVWGLELIPLLFLCRKSNSGVEQKVRDGCWVQNNTVYHVKNMVWSKFTTIDMITANFLLLMLQFTQKEHQL